MVLVHVNVFLHFGPGHIGEAFKSSPKSLQEATTGFHATFRHFLFLIECFYIDFN